jgi:hypothetical protein
MTEAGGGDGRAEVTRRLIERSLEDEEFRRGLLEGVEVRVVEETADTIYLVLPNSSPGGESGELSEQELEVVAGGSSSQSGLCSICGWVSP